MKKTKNSEAISKRWAPLVALSAAATKVKLKSRPWDSQVLIKYPRKMRNQRLISLWWVVAALFTTQNLKDAKANRAVTRKRKISLSMCLHLTHQRGPTMQHQVLMLTTWFASWRVCQRWTRMQSCWSMQMKSWQKMEFMARSRKLVSALVLGVTLRTAVRVTME